MKATKGLKISKRKQGWPRFPKHDEPPGEVRHYKLTPTKLEEFNRKYPPKPEELDKGAKILHDLDRSTTEKHRKRRALL